MARSFRLRLHEWLADHVRFIQYPGVQDESRRLYWKYPMPKEQRVFIGMVSSIAIVLLLSAIGAMLVIAWAFVASN